MPPSRPNNFDFREAPPESINPKGPSVRFHGRIITSHLRYVLFGDLLNVKDIRSYQRLRIVVLSSWFPCYQVDDHPCSPRVRKGTGLLTIAHTCTWCGWAKSISHHSSETLAFCFDSPTYIPTNVLAASVSFRNGLRPSTVGVLLARKRWVPLVIGSMPSIYQGHFPICSPQGRLFFW